MIYALASAGTSFENLPADHSGTLMDPSDLYNNIYNGVSYWSFRDNVHILSAFLFWTFSGTSVIWSQPKIWLDSRCLSIDQTTVRIHMDKRL